MATTRVKTGLVQVDGLAELNKALRAMSKELQGELKLANKEVATFVAADARAAAYSLGGLPAKVAPSIKASAGVGSAGVAFGGPAYPFAGGAEFGANRESQRSRNGPGSSTSYVGYRQFKDWRGSGSDAGYFVYPAIRQDAERIETEYTQAINRLIRKAGLS